MPKCQVMKGKRSKRACMSVRRVLRLASIVFLLFGEGAARATDVPQLFVQLGHSESITSVAISPDDQYVLSGGDEGSVILWERESAREVRTFRGHKGKITAVAFALDGTSILSAGKDGTALLRDRATGREIRRFAFPSNSRLSSASLSRDGQYVALAGDAPFTGRLTFWGGTEMPGQVQLWDIASGQLRHTLEHQAEVSAIAFSPDGRYLLSGTGNLRETDGQVILWEVATGKEVRRFAGHSSGLIFKNLAGVSHVAFSPDGRYALSASHDRTIAVWSIPSGQKVRTFDFRFPATQVAAFAPDGRSILCVRPVQVSSSWRGSSWRESLQLLEVVSGHEGQALDLGPEDTRSVAQSLVVSQNGRYALFNQHNSLRLLDLQGWQVTREYGGHTSLISSLAFSADGTRVLAGHGTNYHKSDNSKPGEASLNLEVWDLTAGRMTHAIPGHAEYVSLTQFSQDGAHLINAGRRVEIREASTTALVRNFPGLEDTRKSVWGVSLDGKRLLRAVQRDNWELWDVETGTLSRKLAGEIDTPEAVTFSPDGHYVLVADSFPRSERGSLVMWDVVADRQMWAIGQGDRYAPSFQAVAWAPGGQYVLAVHWEKIILLNAKTGQEVRTFAREKNGHVRSVAYAPDGRTFLSGSEDGTVTSWDVETGRVLWSGTSHEGPVITIAISPDGTRVASGGDGMIVLRVLATGHEILRMAAFTDGEWVAITPKGYYAASQRGGQYLNVRVGTQVYSIDNFFEQFYRPDIVAEVLRSNESVSPVVVQNEANATVVDMTQAVTLPPVVRFLSPKPGDVFEKDEIDLQVQAIDQGGGVDEIRLYHNGKIVGTDTRDLHVTAKASAATDMIKAYRLRLVDGANIFRAVALSKGRIESNPDELTIQLKAAGKPATLHLLLVGINEYKNPALNLNYALPDAQGVQQYFTGAASTLFHAIKRHELYDKAATKPEIVRQLQELRATAPEDVVVIFLAGHGDSVENTWYFIPHEIVTPEKVLHVQQHGLSSTELKEHVAKIGAQKVLVLIDACKSGSAMLAFASRGVEDRKAMAQLARTTGTHVVAASTKEQFAAEVKDLGHGVFTYTLLEGLSGKADGSPKDGIVTVRELLSYVESRLPEISEQYKQQAQYPVVDSRGQDFPLATVK